MATAATISASLTLSTAPFMTALAGAKAALSAFRSTTSSGFMGLGNIAASVASGIGSAFVGAAAIAGGALIGLGGALTGLATSSFLAYARVKELKFINEQLAEVNGYVVSEVKAEAEEVRALGIEAAVAEKTVAELMKINMDMSKASDIARIAQNAAVISGKNSTEVTDKIIHGITTLNPLVLRHAGIIVDLQAAYKAYAKEQGKSTLQMTTAEKQQVALNEVLKAGERLTGLYEKSMTSASKQLRSFPRYLNEIAVAMGSHFDEAFSAGVFRLADFLKALRDAVSEGGALEPVIKRLADLFTLLFGTAGDAAEGINFQTIADKLFPIVDGVVSFFETAIPLVRQFFDIFKQDTQSEKLGALYLFLVNLGIAFGQSGEKAAEWAGTMIAKGTEVANKIGEVFWTVVGFLQQNQGIIVGVIAVIIASFVAWGLAAVGAAISTLAALWPIILVIALIGLAAGLLYQAWTQNWGGIQEKVQAFSLWFKGLLLGLFMFLEALTTGKLGAWSTIWSNVIESVQVIWTTFTENIKSWLSLFRLAFEGDWYGFGEALRDIWDRSWQAIGTLLENAWSNITALVPILWAKFKDRMAGVDWANIGTNIIKGIAAGLAGAVPILLEAARRVGAAVVDVFKGFFGIHSPSKLMEMEVGKNIALGITKGYQDGMNLSPSLAYSSVSTAMTSGSSGQADENKMMLEEIRILMQTLPQSMKVANRELIEKTGRNRGS